jgi:hypothetical protein
MCVDGGPNFGQVGWSHDLRRRESAIFTLRPEPVEVDPNEPSFIVPQSWFDDFSVPSPPPSCEVQCVRCRAGDHQCSGGPVAGRCCCTECMPF